MKLWKRLACAAALVLCTVFCAVGISAASVTASGTCYNLRWTLYNDGELVISGTGEMRGRPWSSYKSSIQTVTIGNSVTSIDIYAFSGCTALTSVTIGNGVASIGYEAFEACTALTSVTIPNSVTSIGNRAFSRCDSLTEIKVSEENPNYSNDEQGVLFDKTKSNLIQYPKGNTSEKYVIPDSVTSIGHYAFYYCDSLTSVTIPDSVTSIGYEAFEACTALTSVTIPDSVTSIEGYAFMNCTALTSVTIPDSVTVIHNGTFKNCTGLASATIPDSVTSIGLYAFEACTGLTSVTIPDSVTFIGSGAFRSCTGLTEIKVDEDNLCFSNDEYGVLFDKSRSNLIQYPLGNTRGEYALPDSVTSIGTNAFYDCTDLMSVTIPDSVTSIESWAFYSCKSLTNVTIGNSVTSIGNSAFYNCDSLTGVTIPDSVTSIGDKAFTYSDNLTSVTILSRDVKFGSSVFNYTPSNFTLYGYAGSTTGTYANANGHKFVALDEAPETDAPETDVPETDAPETDAPETDAPETDAPETDAPETDAPETDAPETDREITASGECGKNLTWTLYDNGELVISGTGAMWDWTSDSDVPWHSYTNSIQTVTIASGVMSIGNNAFHSCSVLKSVTIPASVKSIGTRVFYSCSVLTSVAIYSRDVLFSSYVFGDTSSAFILYGYTNSTTEAYAEENSLSFVALDAPTPADFTLSSSAARPGETVAVELSLENTNLINSVALYNLTYDTERLTFAGFADYETLEEKCSFGESFDEAQGIITLALTEDEVLSGFLCTLLFEVKEDAAEGDAEISMTSLVKMDYTKIPSEVTAGKITVKHQLIGDINNDDVVDIRDARALFKYSMLPEFYPVDYPFSMDFNGDGYLDINDARLLFKHSMLPDIYPLA